jgi:surface protein
MYETVKYVRGFALRYLKRAATVYRLVNGATDELGGVAPLNATIGNFNVRKAPLNSQTNKQLAPIEPRATTLFYFPFDAAVEINDIIECDGSRYRVLQKEVDLERSLYVRCFTAETYAPIGTPVDPEPPEEPGPEEGITSTVTLFAPTGAVEPGDWVALPYTIITENGTRPNAVFKLRDANTNEELDSGVVEAAQSDTENGNWLYKVPEDVFGELFVYLDVEHSSQVFSSNTVSFEVIEQPIAIIEGTPYYRADLTVIETNGNGRIVTLPANEVLWVDWGTGDPAQLRPTGHEVITSFLDEETEREVVHRPRAISGPDTIMNQEVTIRALFSWNNGDQKTNLSWIKDVKQFGLNFETGKRNQVESGVRAFSQITAVQLTALENLDTSNLLYMNSMFIGASAFNQDLNNFDTSNVKSMANIFQSATDFDGDLSSWDLSSCTQLVSAFRFTNNFTGGGIENWDVSKVISWQEFLRRSFAFNAPIGGWTMSPEVNENRLREMFGEATSFNQDLSGWNVENCPTKPLNFDDGCDSWTLPRPVWGTDGSTTLVNEKKEG